MPKFKELKKTQRKVNKEIRNINKNLKEDCFAGRFEVKMLARKDEMLCMMSYPSYTLAIIDHEEPKTLVLENYHWSDSWGLCDFETLVDELNMFIQESNFWDRWKNEEEYRKSHWYSGKRLAQLNGALNRSDNG